MVPSPQQSHKHHHHDGGAVCPSYSVVSMDTPNQMQVTDGGETAQVKGRADKAILAIKHCEKLLTGLPPLGFGREQETPAP